MQPKSSYPNQQPTVIIANQGPAPAEAEEIPFKSFHFVFGIVQMIIGGLVFVLDIAFFLAPTPNIYGTGIFCGVLIFISGLFSLLGAKQNERCLIIASLVINIIATIACFVAMVLDGLTVNLYRVLSSYKSVTFTSNTKLAYGKFVFFLLVWIFEFIATIVHASLACAVCCTCCKPRKVQNAKTPDLSTQQGIFVAQPGQGHAYVIPEGATVIRTTA